MSNEITTQPQEMRVIEGGQLSIGAMMSALIEKGVTADNVTALEKLADLHERMEAKSAERDFNRDFLALQGELKNITARKEVPTKGGGVKFKFAPYEEIMEEVQPLLLKHGFGIKFSQRFADSRMFVTCKLLHRSGHSESNEFGARIGSGPPGASEAQADGAATTYAKRGALCQALNIVVDQDDDAQAVGGAISLDEAAELQNRVRAMGGFVEEGRFLRFCHALTHDPISKQSTPQEIAACYAAIPTTRMSAILPLLKEKEASFKRGDAK